MSTFPLRAPHLTRVPSFNGFARISAFTLALIDVFVEAQQEARRAHARYPFADW